MPTARQPPGERERQRAQTVGGNEGEGRPCPPENVPTIPRVDVVIPPAGEMSPQVTKGGWIIDPYGDARAFWADRIVHPYE